MIAGSADLVDLLGMVAGAIWMSAALYYQMVRSNSVHPAWISASFLMGVALMMSSSAPVVRGSETVVMLAIAGNALFCILGLGAWVAFSVTASLRDAKRVPNEDGEAYPEP